MFIYSISTLKYGYDSYDGHVIVANDEKEVRSLAKDIDAQEGKVTDVWDIAEIKKHGQYLGKEKKPFIILSSYNAG